MANDHDEPVVAVLDGLEIVELAPLGPTIVLATHGWWLPVSSIAVLCSAMLVPSVFVLPSIVDSST